MIIVALKIPSKRPGGSSRRGLKKGEKNSTANELGSGPIIRMDEY